METSSYLPYDFHLQSALSEFMEFEQTHLLLHPKNREFEDIDPLDDILFAPEGPEFPVTDTFDNVFLDFDENPDFPISDAAPLVASPPFQDHFQSHVEPITELNQEESLNFITEEFHNASNTSGSNLTDMLLSAVEAVATGNIQVASTILPKLSSLSPELENGDYPFNRLIFYFTQSLSSRITRMETHVEPGPIINESLQAFEVLQDLTPYIKFAHFTANQAILEGTHGVTGIHIIDFDIMEGIQWPPLMVELALRNEAFLRITAIVDSTQVDRNWASNQTTGRRLGEFANSIGLPFRFDQILVGKANGFEGLETGEVLVVNCMMHMLHMPYRNSNSRQTFMEGVRKLKPRMVVLVQEELFSFGKVLSQSFVDFFVEAFQHYHALFESLLNGFPSRSKLGLEMIEAAFLGPRILDCFQWFPLDKRKKGRLLDYGFLMQGFQVTPMSASNISQAKLLVGLFTGNYEVQHENCRLKLYWKSRPITTVSIWFPV
ncbi:hypothetical protein AMTRI_Chr11g94770 [Amborella trichopoda]|uniref:Uncharacterized protein n=1 Tax=Amborella trichopoda TaxID=13333 RepID=U5D0V1_AMBTC|nr:hypothetical protein AMTR_s00030p00099410 [Amborella trichopoda]